MIVVGAASKGIIQRDHQHNAVVYKQYYAPNPFESMSEDEVEKYKRDIENKAKGVTGMCHHMTETAGPCSIN